MKLYSVASPLYVEEKIIIDGDATPLVNAVTRAINILNDFRAQLKNIVGTTSETVRSQSALTTSLRAVNVELAKTVALRTKIASLPGTVGGAIPALPGRAGAVGVPSLPGAVGAPALGGEVIPQSLKDAQNILKQLNSSVGTLGGSFNALKGQIGGVSASLSTANFTIGNFIGTALAGLSKLAAAFVSLGRIIGIALAIGTVFRLVGALEEGIKSSIEFSQAISEIRTIQGDVNLSTQAWAEELRVLSDAFGISILDQAEGAYQAISNQIIQTTSDFEFLTAANKLALATISDVSDTVNLLSSALKSFNIPATESEEVAGKFFKTIELGRVRAEELANTFGRVGIFASQLGVSLDETLAGIASITVQGVKSEEALTLLRNVFLKLADPTEEFKDLLREQGFASGEALIAARGLAGTLALVEEATKGSSSEIAELFSRIRASIGVTALIGEQFKTFSSNLDEISGAGVRDVNDAANEIAQSSGRQLIIEGQKIQNFFEKDIGLAIVDSLAKVNKSIGGFTTILKSTGGFLKDFGGTISATIVLLVALSKTSVLSALSITGFRVALAAALAELKLFVGGLLLSNPIFVALAAVALAATLAIEVFADAQREALKVAEASNIRIINSLQDAAAANAIAQNKILKDFNRSLRAETALAVEGIASVAKRAREQAKESIKIFEDLAPAVTTAFKAGLNAIRLQLRFVNRDLGRLTRSARESANEIREIFEETEAGLFSLQLGDVGVSQQISSISQRIETLNTRVGQAIARGNREVVQNLLSQIRELSDQRLKLNKEVSDNQASLDQSLFRARQDLRDADGSQERRAARDRLFLIRREGQLRQDLSDREADAAVKILQLIRERRTADPSRREEINKELRIARNEQKTIQESVEAEVRARFENVSIVSDTADKLAELSAVEKARARELAIQQAQIQSQFDSLRELTSESQKFKIQEALKIKDSEELRDTLKEQEDRLKAILRINKSLGLESKDRLNVEQQLKNLQQTRRFAVREAEARELQQRLQSLRSDANAAVERTLQGTSALRDNLRSFVSAINNSVDTLTGTGDFTIGTSARREGGRDGRTIPGTPLFDLADTSIPRLVTEISRELQGERRPEEVEALARELNKEFKSIEQVLSTINPRRLQLDVGDQALLDALGNLSVAVGSALRGEDTAFDFLTLQDSIKGLIDQQALTTAQEREALKAAKLEEDSRNKLANRLKDATSKTAELRAVNDRLANVRIPDSDSGVFGGIGKIFNLTGISAGDAILESGENVADAFRTKIVEGFEEGGKAAVKAARAERQRQREEDARKARENLLALTGDGAKPTIAQQVESRLLKQLADLPADSKKRNALIQQLIELQFRNPSLEINKQLLESLPETTQQALQKAFSDSQRLPSQALDQARAVPKFDPFGGITPAITPDFRELPNVSEVNNTLTFGDINVTTVEGAEEFAEKVFGVIKRGLRRGTLSFK